MLQTCRAHMGEVVKRRMVVNLVANKGEIEPLIAGGSKNSEVCVVRKLSVSGEKEGTGHRARGLFRELTDGPFIGAARLEHNARPGSAPRIQVHCRPHAFRPPMRVDEGACAEQSRFL